MDTHYGIIIRKVKRWRESRKSLNHGKINRNRNKEMLMRVYRQNLLNFAKDWMQRVIDMGYRKKTDRCQTCYWRRGSENKKGSQTGGTIGCGEYIMICFWLRALASLSLLSLNWFIVLRIILLHLFRKLSLQFFWMSVFQTADCNPLVCQVNIHLLSIKQIWREVKVREARVQSPEILVGVGVHLCSCIYLP